MAQVGAAHVQVAIELPPGARRMRLGPKAKRTQRQRFLIEHGFHPLSLVVPGRTLKLPDGADRRGVRPLKAHQRGPRCGGCKYLERLIDGEPKCFFGEGKRITNGAATTVRLWWPGCRDYAPADPGAPAG
jgi:hypothetical protein